LDEVIDLINPDIVTIFHKIHCQANPIILAQGRLSIHLQVIHDSTDPSLLPKRGDDRAVTFLPFEGAVPVYLLLKKLSAWRRTSQIFAKLFPKNLSFSKLPRWDFASTDFQSGSPQKHLQRHRLFQFQSLLKLSWQEAHLRLSP